MQIEVYVTQPPERQLSQQVAHILVAGLWSSDKTKLIRHVSDTPLESVNVAEDFLPVKMPDLLMGEMKVDDRLTAHVWGAPKDWRHDYVNYLVNIKTILLNRGDHHRMMGMIIVVDSLRSASSEDEGKLVRLVQSDWHLPYFIVASHPHEPYARHPETIRADYHIHPDVPILPYDISQATEAKRAMIELMYRAM